MNQVKLCRNQLLDATIHYAAILSHVVLILYPNRVHARPYEDSSLLVPKSKTQTQRPPCSFIEY